MTKIHWDAIVYFRTQQTLIIQFVTAKITMNKKLTINSLKPNELRFHERWQGNI